MEWERIKILELGAEFDDEYIEFENMDAEQLLYLGELEYREEFQHDNDYFDIEYFENDCWEEFIKKKERDR